MKVVINAKEASVQSADLESLAKELSLPDRGVAIAVDNCMVPRSEWSSRTISEGDRIMIITAACGG